MRVLIIKLSSMGDILHTLPALTECKTYFPSMQFDWLVEPGFKEILTWHPGIQQIIDFPLRAARKNPKLFFTEIPKVLKNLRSQEYDLVIDAQGLIKSALLAKMAKSKKKVGLDKDSCREPWASQLYDKGYKVPWSDHAVNRIKNLFSQIFSYPINSDINYGIDKTKLIQPIGFVQDKQFLIFLHGTTWVTKHWPEQYWSELIHLVLDKYPEWHIYLPFGSQEEYNRANRWSKISHRVKILPKSTLGELAYYIACAEAVISVDTGLGHLAAAIGTQTINLYGPTDPKRTGTWGLNQVHLSVNQLNPETYACAPCLKRQCFYRGEKKNETGYPPCYQEIPPELVMKNLVL